MNKNNNMDNRKSEEQLTQPVSDGEVITFTINEVGDKGDGIAKVRGFIIIVKNSKKGQKLKIKISKVLKSVAFADIVEELKNNGESDEVVYSSNSYNKKQEFQKPEKRNPEELFDEELDSENF